MKTVTLNCASCGAPVFIPDGAETFVCPSCQTTLMVDRGEGYITLKVLEKLSDSIQEMGKATSSAIEQNTFATQMELKRMQLQHLVSLEEMKLSSLQSELRAAAWRAQANVITVDMEDIILQINASKMHIRSLKKEIAQLDPGWEESLEVFRQDLLLLDEAIAFLTPYNSTFKVSNLLSEVNHERRRAVAVFNQLETRLLRRDVKSLQYPPFDQLSMDQMEELMETIPGDLTRLEAFEKTEAKEKVIAELKETLQKIKAYFPRKKLESLVGPVVSLDYKKPFPNSMEERQPLIAQANADLEKVNSIPAGAVRTQFNQQLHALLDDLNTFPVKGRGKNKKRKGRWFLILILVIVGLACLLALLIFGTAVYRNIKEGGTATGLVSQVQNFANNNSGDSSGESAYLPGQFEPYQRKYVEVTAGSTFLREAPDLNAEGSVKVVQGQILVDLEESGLASPWYKVMTMDGTDTGYLVRDWVNPITVEAVPGDSLMLNQGVRFYTEDFTTSDNAWEPETFDDEYATGSTMYLSGEFVVEMVTHQPYVYRYATLIVDNLPEEYYYSLSGASDGRDDTVYYGIQTNMASDANFDAMLIDSDGAVKVLLVRDYNFSLIYDSEDPVNTMAGYNASGANRLSMHRYIDAATGAIVNEYALNGAVVARITFGDPGDLINEMGWMIFVDDQDITSKVHFDDFLIEQ